MLPRKRMPYYSVLLVVPYVFPVLERSLLFGPSSLTLLGEAFADCARHRNMAPVLYVLNKAS